MLGTNNIADDDHGYDATQVRGLNPQLSRIENLFVNQKRTYEQIYLKQKDFDMPTYHYDWWLFPVPMPKDQYWSPTAAYFSLNKERTYQLLANDDFVKRYLACIDLYLQAQNNKWNGYEVRFGKVLLSLMHFIAATKDLAQYKELNEALLKQANFAIAIANANGLNRKDFPYDAYFRMDELLSIYKEKFTPTKKVSPN